MHNAEGVAGASSPLGVQASRKRHSSSVEPFFVYHMNAHPWPGWPSHPAPCYRRRVRRILTITLIAFLSCPAVAAAGDTVSRRDGFLLIWASISREAEKTQEKPYEDVPSGSPGALEITYAKARGLLDDDITEFRPDAPFSPTEALLWIFRTRNIEPVNEEGVHVISKMAEMEDITALSDFYSLSYDREGTSMTREQLLELMRITDAALAEEVHEVSLYSEKFHGKGTAFGEGFDMNALTAAHRMFPHNTLVRVTNVEDGKSVTVRINDRGPFVAGRDMDLSLRAFTDIAPRSRGKINARFERLGDSNIVLRCKDDRYQRRITKDVRLSPGIPHSLPLGASIRLTSESPFVVRDIAYPDGVRTGTEVWVTEGEMFEFAPSTAGMYRFMIGTKTGRVREMRMEVVDCTS